jgi:hypothetical protein
MGRRRLKIGREVEKVGEDGEKERKGEVERKEEQGIRRYTGGREEGRKKKIERVERRSKGSGDGKEGKEVGRRRKQR